MSNRQFVIFGIVGIVVALVAGALALWLVIASQ